MTGICPWNKVGKCVLKHPVSYLFLLVCFIMVLLEKFFRLVEKDVSECVSCLGVLEACLLPKLKYTYQWQKLEYFYIIISVFPLLSYIYGTQHTRIQCKGDEIKFFLEGVLDY